MKFSIITPSYNQGRYLQANIDSIHAQTGVEVEHIVMDGGSNDESIDVLKHNDKILTHWVSEKDKGQTDAINKGIKKATGDILTWINSDDLLTPHALLEVKSIFEEQDEIALIHGRSILFDENGKEQVTAGQRDQVQDRYLAGMCFPQPSSFFRRSALETVGLPDDKYHFGMDYELFVRMYLQFDFLPVDNIFSKYLLHDESKTMTSNVKFADDWARIFSKVLRSFDFTSEIIQDMKSLGLYVDEQDVFVVKKAFDKHQLEASFLYHLGYQLYYRYEGYDLKKVKEISKYLKLNHRQHFDKMGYKTMMLRSSMPKGVLKTLKSIRS